MERQRIAFCLVQEGDCGAELLPILVAAFDEKGVGCKEEGGDQDDGSGSVQFSLTSDPLFTAEKTSPSRQQRGGAECVTR